MESLMTKKTPEEVAEESAVMQARKEIEEAGEQHEVGEISHNKEAQPAPVDPPRVLRIELPVDLLLTANRKQKRTLYADLVKNINAKIEMIRQEERIKG